MANVQPAIRRTAGDNDRATVEKKLTGKTRFERGLGQVGTRVEVVKPDPESNGGFDGCPACGHDKMVRAVDLRPDEASHMTYYCLDFTCPHFVCDELEYDHNYVRSSQPHTWDNLAECPDCGKRHRIELSKQHMHHVSYVEGNSDVGGIVERLCMECLR